MNYLVQVFFIGVFYLSARPYRILKLHELLVLFLLASLFDEVAWISKKILKGYSPKNKITKGRTSKLNLVQLLTLS